jgi:hypothetical protein
MASEDLAFALKNAIDRGESLEKAAASLISAGYGQQEVGMAVQMVSQMISTQSRKISLSTTAAPVQQIQLVQRPQLQQNFAQLPKSGLKNGGARGKGLVIASITVVSLLILLLIGILFAIILG